MYKIDITEKYRQQYAHFGRMNDILYKLPILFSTLIGGLWYFAFSFMDKSIFISVVVLLFTSILSIIFTLVVHRFRLAFNAYIDNINKMDEEMKVSLRDSKSPSTILLIQISLITAMTLSIASIIFLMCCRKVT